jgi:hypothetical protein
MAHLTSTFAQRNRPTRMATCSDKVVTEVQRADSAGSDP